MQITTLAMTRKKLALLGIIIIVVLIIQGIIGISRKSPAKTEQSIMQQDNPKQK